jgi:hypothetical protein
MAVYRIVRKRQPVMEEYDPKLRGTQKNADRAADALPETDRREQYMEKLLRLIPADVVAAYLTIRSFWFPASTNAVDPLASAVRHWWLPIGGMIVTIILRTFGTARRPFSGSDVQWSVVIASGVSFLTWVFALNDPVFGLSIDPRVSASALVLVALLVPLLVKPVND